MDKVKFAETKIIARQILLYFVDFNRTILELFDRNIAYRIPLKAYDRFREADKIRFSQELYHLKQRGLIKEYFKDKEKFIELTKKGKARLKNYITHSIQIKKPQKWDKKWHLVIFDIPNDKKGKREFLRDKLESLGFYKLQESVYVFPFDCRKEISLIKNMYFMSPYVQYIIADRIETETNLIKKFLNSGILTEKMFKK